MPFCSELCETDVRQYPSKEKEAPEAPKSKDKPRGNPKWGILSCAAILLLCVIIGIKTGTRDVSAGKNGAVQAWVKRTGDSFVLFIAAEGGIQAPEKRQRPSR